MSSYLEVPQVRARETRREDLLEEARMQRLGTEACSHPSRRPWTWRLRPVLAVLGLVLPRRRQEPSRVARRVRLWTPELTIFDRYE